MCLLSYYVILCCGLVCCVLYSTALKILPGKVICLAYVLVDSLRVVLGAAAI